MDGPTRDGDDALPVHRTVRRAVVVSLVRSLASFSALLTLYFLVPLDVDSGWRALAVLAVAVVALVGVVVGQLRAVLVSSRPALRAVEALAVSVPSFVLLFASGYVVMSDQDPTSFNEPLSRVDAMYFSVTTLSTTGFGDIAAHSDLARLVVSAQMIIDLVVLGLGLKVVLSAVQIARQRTTADRRGARDGA